MSVLEKLVKNSQSAIDSGVYDGVARHEPSGVDLVRAVREHSHAPVISEVKFSSPSEGEILRGANPADVARLMVDGGAVALSVLTQPHMFDGSPANLALVRDTVDIPILMKDIIVDARQLEAARQMGADYVLIIQAVFDHGLAANRDELVDLAHAGGMGVLLEAHTRAELDAALESGADMVGVNNRNLDTLEVDLDTTRRVLDGLGERGVPIVSESGIGGPGDVRRLRECGADAFLAGTSIMRSANIAESVRSLVMAI